MFGLDLDLLSRYGEENFKRIQHENGLLSVALIWPIFLAACANSGAGQMTPEKFKDMYAMLLKLDELKKKEIITEAEFLEQKTKLLGN